MYDFGLSCRNLRKAVYPLQGRQALYQRSRQPRFRPLEFFWNVADAMDQKLKGRVGIAEGAVKRYNEEHQQQVPSDKGSLSQMSRLPTPPKYFHRLFDLSMHQKVSEDNRGRIFGGVHYKVLHQPR